MAENLNISRADVGQQTADVEDRLRFDEAALARYLARAVPGFAGTLTVKKFGYGQSNPTFHIKTSEGQEYVLRKQPPGELIKGAHAVDREFRVMDAVGRAGFCVPKVLALCEDKAIIGTSFYVMDFKKGSIPDNGLTCLPPSQRRPCLLAIMRSLARLHSYDPKELGLLGGEKPFGRAGGFYERNLRTMVRVHDDQVRRAGGKLAPLTRIMELVAMFQANMPEDRSCVIHGDWKPDNIIMSDTYDEPVAAIDWELSTIGHPLSDLANICLPYHAGGNLVGWPVYEPTAENGIPLESEVHQAYCEAAGVPYPIADWDFHAAFNCFRFSVIVHGIGMRAALGVLSAAGSASVESYHAAADSMCEIACRKMAAKVARSKL